MSSHRRVHVAHVNKHSGMIEEDTANANLITAAPDLLQALKLIQEHADVMAKSADMYRGWFAKTAFIAAEAIAKAEART